MRTMLAYAALAFVLVFPPKALEGFGLTVPALLGSFLGNEGQHFVWYHVRRTTATVLVHALAGLVFSFHIALGYSSHLSAGEWRGLVLQLLWLVVTVASACGLALAGSWRLQGWARHPIARMLSVYRENWERAAAAIEIEFRRIDKFSVKLGNDTLVVTDTWILHVTLYRFVAIHQNDADLSLLGANDAPRLGAIEQRQILSVGITSVRPKIGSIVVRVDAGVYRDLQLKLNATIRNSRNIVVRLSPNDRFSALFRARALQNPRIPLREEHRGDICVGCMTNPIEVGLIHRCGKATCADCFCRPMVCVECLAKWFASEQPIYHEPDAWLAGNGHCPVCRAAFCVEDVSLCT